MILVFVIFYGLSIYVLIQRYKKSEKKAEMATLEGEKEILNELAKKHKKQAIFTILYMLIVIIGIMIIFNFTS